jgi:hypothetical protein
MPGLPALGDWRDSFMTGGVGQERHLPRTCVRLLLSAKNCYACGVKCHNSAFRSGGQPCKSGDKVSNSAIFPDYRLGTLLAALP